MKKKIMIIYKNKINYKLINNQIKIKVKIIHKNKK